MLYLGGKQRIAHLLRHAILAEVPRHQRLHYTEPFCGGMSMMVSMAHYFEKSQASDTHEDLMMMWIAAQEGWRPPSHVDENEYRRLQKSDRPSALRGFVGFACSFGAKWFGGYARGNKENYAASEAKRVIDEGLYLRFQKTHLSQKRYDQTVVRPGDVLYCDPPYEDSTGYKTEKFNHKRFWQTLEDWTKMGARVFVSEYQAPPHWTELWNAKVAFTMNGSIGEYRHERLFTLK